MKHKLLLAGFELGLPIPYLITIINKYTCKHSKKRSERKRESRDWWNLVVRHGRDLLNQGCHGKNWESPLSSYGHEMVAATADDNDEDDDNCVCVCVSVSVGVYLAGDIKWWLFLIMIIMMKMMINCVRVCVFMSLCVSVSVGVCLCVCVRERCNFGRFLSRPFTSEFNPN